MLVAAAFVSMKVMRRATLGTNRLPSVQDSRIIEISSSITIVTVNRRFELFERIG